MRHVEPLFALRISKFPMWQKCYWKFLSCFVRLMLEVCECRCWNKSSNIEPRSCIRDIPSAESANLPRTRRYFCKVNSSNIRLASLNQSAKSRCWSTADFLDTRGRKSGSSVSFYSVRLALFPIDHWDGRSFDRRHNTRTTWRVTRAMIIVPSQWTEHYCRGFLCT